MQLYIRSKVKRGRAEAPASTGPSAPAQEGCGRRASQLNRAAGSRSAAFAFWLSQCWKAQEHDSRNGRYGIFGRDRADHSGFMPANLITLAHFSVSSAMSFPKSAGEPGSTVPPRSARRALILGSSRAALTSLLSLSTILAGVFLGTPTPYHVVASPRDSTPTMRRRSGLVDYFKMK